MGNNAGGGARGDACFFIEVRSRILGSWERAQAVVTGDLLQIIRPRKSIRSLLRHVWHSQDVLFLLAYGKSLRLRKADHFLSYLDSVKPKLDPSLLGDSPGEGESLHPMLGVQWFLDRPGIRLKDHNQGEQLFAVVNRSDISTLTALLQTLSQRCPQVSFLLVLANALRVAPNLLGLDLQTPVQRIKSFTEFLLAFKMLLFADKIPSPAVPGKIFKASIAEMPLLVRALGSTSFSFNLQSEILTVKGQLQFKLVSGESLTAIQTAGSIVAVSRNVKLQGSLLDTEYRDRSVRFGGEAECRDASGCKCTMRAGSEGVLLKVEEGGKEWLGQCVPWQHVSWEGQLTVDFIAGVPLAALGQEWSVS